MKPAPQISSPKKALAGLTAVIGVVIASVFGLEGGYSSHPADTGGTTMYGITESVARANGYTGPMIALPKETAQQIYEQSYVLGPKFDQVLLLSLPVGHKLIDAGVNVGTVRASRWFQIALNALSRAGKDYALVDEDGVIGPATLSAYQSLKEKRGAPEACRLVLKLLDVQQGHHYLSLTKHRDFTVGWLSNRIQNVPLEDCNE